MNIREANLDDAAAIAKVHVDAWRTTYRGIVPDGYLAKLSYTQREQNWHKMLSSAINNYLIVYVVENEYKQIVGFANGGAERNHHPIYQSELYAIYILEAYQRRGIGHRLIQIISQKLWEAGFHSMLVWVLAANSACRFYASLGGQQIDAKQMVIGGRTLDEIAYGWTDIKSLLAESKS